MQIQKSGENELKITIDEKDLGEFKGLDKNGNCYFKFDFKDKSGMIFKLRVPHEVGYELVLLMREQLIKFFGNTNRLSNILNSKEKLEFEKLKEALIENKSLEEKIDLKRSISYNNKYFDKMGEKISEIEIQQEEAIIENIKKQSLINKQDIKNIYKLDKLGRDKLKKLEGVKENEN